MVDVISPPVLGCWCSRGDEPVFRELSVAEQRYQAVLAVIKTAVRTSRGEIRKKRTERTAKSLH
jgi:hypothetical protein